MVKDFAPFERLAWLGSAFGTEGYHSWVIEQSGKGCTVTTEETQRGFIPWLLRFFLKRIIHKRHKEWLKKLDENVAKGNA